MDIIRKDIELNLFVLVDLITHPYRSDTYTMIRAQSDGLYV